MSELKALRRKIAELQGIEECCHKAEEALKATETRNQLLAAADKALFSVKDNGKNGICQYKDLEEMRRVA